MVRINGEELDVAGSTLSEYLSKTDYDANRIAVEINNNILPKDKYSKTVLRDGDIVEIVSFVGGG